MRRNYPKYATIFSIASDQCRKKGLDSITSLMGDLLPTDRVHAYLGEYAPEVAVRLLGNASAGRRLLEEHSHFRVIGRLLERPDERRMFDSILVGGFEHRKLFDRVRGQDGIESYTLRSCPHCVAEDECRYGIAHWRVFHQWPGVQACPDHGGLLHENCTDCGKPRVQGDVPLLPSDPCQHCGGTTWGPRYDAEFPVELEMARVLWALLGISEEDADSHRPLERYRTIANARIVWYEAGEEGDILERVCDALSCHDLEELAERLEYSHLPSQTGANLNDDFCAPPILIVACIATATQEQRGLFSAYYLMAPTPALGR